MNCIKCNAILPEGAKFCSLCGQPTKKEELTKNSTICINCRKEFDSSHVFCDRCGYRLMTKEHYIKECSNPILNIKSVKRFNGKKLKNKIKSNGKKKGLRNCLRDKYRLRKFC